MSQPNLTEDLNIIAQSDLEITYMDGDLNIIQALDDEPNDVGGLSSAELKAKFDEGPNKIKNFLNNSLIPELLAADATEAARAAAESAREENEAQRIENENARVEAEQDRSAAEVQRENSETQRANAESVRIGSENARISNENSRVSAEELRQSAEAARNVWEDYNGAKAYVPGNKVYWHGNSYVCLRDCAGITPENASYWQTVVHSGFTEDSMFSFDVVDGRLICYYQGDNPPPFHIGEDGHLYADTGSGKATDLGKVTNIDAEVADAEAARDKAKEYADAAAGSAAVYDDVVADVNQLKQDLSDVNKIAEKAYIMTDARDNKKYGMEWGVNKDGYPTVTFQEVTE